MATKKNPGYGSQMKPPKPKVNPKAYMPSTGGGGKPKGAKGAASPKPTATKYGGAPRPNLPSGAKAQARQALRQQTRQAIKGGYAVKPTKKGLGITKNEKPGVNKSIKTLGYKQAVKVVQRTTKRVSSKKK